MSNSLAAMMEQNTSLKRQLEIEKARAMRTDDERSAHLVLLQTLEEQAEMLDGKLALAALEVHSSDLLAKRFEKEIEETIVTEANKWKVIINRKTELIQHLQADVQGLQDQLQRQRLRVVNLPDMTLSIIQQVETAPAAPRALNLAAMVPLSRYPSAMSLDSIPGGDRASSVASNSTQQPLVIINIDPNAPPRPSFLARIRAAVTKSARLNIQGSSRHVAVVRKDIKDAETEYDRVQKENTSLAIANHVQNDTINTQKEQIETQKALLREYAVRLQRHEDELVWTL
ncbi:hypothetical protein B0J11DRAFT_119197 [Dendryphion nanum]|uniref:Uncharacterized protein n=1 Tax=Dendryphion nanum TaxID=256645 RepID=A0A9P9DC14_9PLEO|nr:hypothetical protein B0J11DRAFT_119197 [Dendryphion nanum]